MARVEIASLALGEITDVAGNSKRNVTTTILDAVGDPATVYASTAGTATTTSFSDELGYTAGWLDPGTYTFQIGDRSHTVEAVSGADSASEGWTSADFTIDVEDYPTLQAAVDAAGLRLIRPLDTCTVNLPDDILTVTGATAILNLAHKFADRINIVGVAALAYTIEEVVSVEGTPGAWVTKLRLSDTTNVLPGHGVAISGMVGTTTPGLLTGFVEANACRLGFFPMGTANPEGTTVSLSKRTVPGGTDGFANTCLEVGDLFHYPGFTRTITDIASDGTSFEIDAPLGTTPEEGAPPGLDPPDDLDLSAQQYWYFSKPNAGTVGSDGTTATVTGTGTDFVSDANVGDLLICDAARQRITAITDAGHIVLQFGVVIPAGTKYTIVTAALLHEGGFQITDVDDDVITVLNTSQLPPPVNKVDSGNARIVRSVLQQTGTGSGIVQNGCALKSLSKVALFGGTSGFGLSLLGDTGAPSQMTLGADVIVGGFSYGARVTGSSYLYAPNGIFAGQNTRCISLENGGGADLTGAIVHGCKTGMGVFNGPNSKLRCSGFRNCGHKLYALRTDENSGTYADFPITYGNGSHGVYGVEFCSMHWVGALDDANGVNGPQSGCIMTNGVQGRFSGHRGWGNGGWGLTIIGGIAEAHYTWSAGNGKGGTRVERGELWAIKSSADGNHGRGWEAFNTGRIYADDGVSRLNTSYGVRCDKESKIFGSRFYSKNNTLSHYSADNGSVISIPAYLGTPTFSPTLNQEQVDRALITDGLDHEMPYLIDPLLTRLDDLEAAVVLLDPLEVGDAIVNHSRRRGQPGVSFPDMVRSITTLTMGAATGYFMRVWIDEDWTATLVWLHSVTTAVTDKADAGVYRVADNGTDLTRLGSQGPLNGIFVSGSTGAKTFTLAASTDLPAGAPVYVGIWSRDGGTVVRSSSASDSAGAQPFGSGVGKAEYMSKTGLTDDTAGLPATIVAPTAAANVPEGALRES